MRPPDVINLQHEHKVDLKTLKVFANHLSANVSEAAGSTFTVAIIDDERMRQLNKLFRDQDSTTDVLSFPHEPDEFDPERNNLGDIVISAEQADRQAGENGLGLDTEIKQLLLHGLLHLSGYDHETDNGEMNARELELRKTVGIG